MPRLSLSEKQIREVAGWVAAHIAQQRAALRGKAQPIAPKHKAALEMFFPPDILIDVRVVRGQANEPSFYPRLRAMGIRNAPPFPRMAGITFQDVVVHVEPLTRSLLFHELVHAVQYKQLGVERFAERYVRGFLKGGSYEAIPLEKQAYELESRFVANPAAAFPVADDVRDRIRLNRL